MIIPIIVKKSLKDVPNGDIPTISNKLKPTNKRRPIIIQIITNLNCLSTSITQYTNEKIIFKNFVFNNFIRKLYLNALFTFSLPILNQYLNNKFYIMRYYRFEGETDTYFFMVLTVSLSSLPKIIDFLLL